MIWLFRKLLIPIAAFGCGMWYQHGLATQACLDAQGIWSAGVCQGARP
ncbi:hypothetical protein QQG91_12475 [Marivivens sp. LCG002]|nr:hypothetical protein [Marivivens sp. LCG002]WIV50475.1 hypothetical protein QQG91_12475 [Marivivens sp. LCG002]